MGYKSPFPATFREEQGQGRGQLGAPRVRREQDMGVAPCCAVARSHTVEMKLLLALAGVLVTLILAQPCEGTVPGNSPLDRQGEGQWRGKYLGVGGLWLHWT